MTLITKAKKVNDFKADPIGFIADAIITIIVNLVIPVPLAGSIVETFRGPVLGCLATAIIMGLFMIVVIGTAIMFPFIVGASFFKKTTTFDVTHLNVEHDGTFYETNLPRQNPFGGPGMSYINITAQFMSPSYFLQFARIHYGVDLIPSSEYYKSSKTYKGAGKIIIFSTINGQVDHYIDQYGGKTVAITNSDNTYKIIYIHFSQFLVEDGSMIKAGTPIGVMGSTGFATGDHVHYEIRVNQDGSFKTVNPVSYIN